MFVIIAAGKRYELQSGKVTVTLDRPDRVEWKGEFAAGDVRVNTTAWLEYDGVMRIDFTLSAKESTQVDSFGLEFPLVPEVARFIHYHTAWGRHDNLAAPKEVGDVLEFPWQSTWWLGDHDRGLTVFTENNFDWSDGPAAVRLERRDDTTVLQLNIWTEPRQLDSPVKFSLGLHATPSKPLPARWQGRYAAFSGGEHLPGSYTSVWHKNQKFYSYPQPADPDAYRELITKKHNQGERVCPYFTPDRYQPGCTGCESALRRLDPYAKKWRSALDWPIVWTVGRVAVYAFVRRAPIRIL